MRRLFGLGANPKTFEFKCADCGALHRGSPSFGYKHPPQYLDVPEEDRAARVWLSEDACVISPAAGEQSGKPDYYIRGILEVPIHGASEPFLWGVWVTQSKESFDRYLETFRKDQSDDGSFGWLPVSMPHYRRIGQGEQLENLRCNVVWQGQINGRGQRPLIQLQECDHPLFIDQRDGISWERAIEIARLVMHG